MALTKTRRLTRAAEAESLLAEQRQKRRIELAIALMLLWPSGEDSEISSLASAITVGTVESFRSGSRFAGRDVALLGGLLGAQIAHVAVKPDVNEWADRARIGARNWFSAWRDKIAELEPSYGLTSAKAAAGQLEWRVNRIAATETPQAFNEARRDSIRASVDKSGVDPALIERVWVCELDACPVCFGLAGTTARLDGPYPHGHEPGGVHNHCRCSEDFRTVR
jgi:hypothetical protein